MDPYGACPACGCELDPEALRRGRCPSCEAELRPSTEDRPLSPDELSEEASRDSYPASDPPSW